MLKVLYTDLSSLLIRLHFFTTFYKINRQAVYEQSAPALVETGDISLMSQRPNRNSLY